MKTCPVSSKNIRRLRTPDPKKQLKSYFTPMTIDFNKAFTLMTEEANKKTQIDGFQRKNSKSVNSGQCKHIKISSELTVLLGQKDAKKKKQIESNKIDWNPGSFVRSQQFINKFPVKKLKQSQRQKNTSQKSQKENYSKKVQSHVKINCTKPEIQNFKQAIQITTERKQVVTSQVVDFQQLMQDKKKLKETMKKYSGSNSHRRVFSFNSSSKRSTDPVVIVKEYLKLMKMKQLR